ncbi:MAG TPA: proteasome subunit alpha [Actinopolymorphaceae bacterium]
MTMPFYVSPEQQMRDRADYARKNIARGRGAIVLQYEHGIALVAENRHRALHKISEIYDRVAFAAVGRYNEFEALRVGGVRKADMQGYAFDRADVTALMLANWYAQILGTIFSSVGEKPYEVETFVVEVGETTETDQIYRLTYDGSVASEVGFAAMGGSAEQISAYAQQHYRPGLSLADALRLAVDALGQDGTAPRTLEADQLEVAVLDRTRPQKRKFKRIVGAQLDRLLAASSAESGAPGKSPEESPGNSPGSDENSARSDDGSGPESAE